MLFLPLLLILPGNALAQQTAAPSGPAARIPSQAAQQTLTPEQQAQVARQNVDMARGAAQVAQLIDEDKTDKVWQDASSEAKRLVSREYFVGQISVDRLQLGNVVERKRIHMNRSAYAAGKQTPAGNYVYVTVAYATKFANSPELVRELICFRLDEDSIWRISG